LNSLYKPVLDFKPGLGMTFQVILTHVVLPLSVIDFSLKIGVENAFGCLIPRRPTLRGSSLADQSHTAYLNVQYPQHHDFSETRT
jgi:hypothetical protein